MIELLLACCDAWIRSRFISPPHAPPAPASSRLGHSIERKTDDAIIARGREWHHWLGLGEQTPEPVAEQRFSRSFALRTTPINSHRALLTLTVCASRRGASRCTAVRRANAYP